MEKIFKNKWTWVIIIGIIILIYGYNKGWFSKKMRFGGGFGGVGFGGAGRLPSMPTSPIMPAPPHPAPLPPPPMPHPHPRPFPRQIPYYFVNYNYFPYYNCENIHARLVEIKNRLSNGENVMFYRREIANLISNAINCNDYDSIKQLVAEI